MKLVKSLFIAVLAVIVTTIVGSTFTHLINETEDANKGLNILSGLLGTIVHAEEEIDIRNDIPEDANHTFTTSLNTYTPSTVIDKQDLPTPLIIHSQSPQTEGQQDSSIDSEHKYINLLIGLVPVSGEDIDYETVLGLTQEEIKDQIEYEGLTIWDIAEAEEKVYLLESAYKAVYPARIIDLLEQEIITQDVADALIEKAYEDIENHNNTSVELMLEEMLNQE